VSELDADVILLDDGFQHRGLSRDLDVVAIDATNGRGNGHLLPRGPNREPVSALERAHLIWLSHADGASTEELDRLRELARKMTGRGPVESRHAVTDVLSADLGRSFGPRALEGRRVLLLSGLARPDGFRRTLQSIGAAVAVERAFRDHHRFTVEEGEEALRSATAAGCDLVATTEKDAMRLPPSVAGDDRLRAVRIEAEVLAGEGILEEALDEGLARRGRLPARNYP
jgi:tetraacyldisaccharide 4'-kinase